MNVPKTRSMPNQQMAAQKKNARCGVEHLRQVYVDQSLPQGQVYLNQIYKTPSMRFCMAGAEDIFADIVHRTGIKDISFDANCTETIPNRAVTEVFWDAFEQDPLTLQSKQSISSFGDLASNNDSGYWTDSDQVGAIPWNSYNPYPTFPEPQEGNLFSLRPDTREDIQAFPDLEEHARASNTVDSNFRNSSIADSKSLQLSPHQDSPALPDETSDRTYTALLLEDPAQISLQPSPAQPEETLMCSDDPFMGWASKKANHLFDDYGWVLSHVENL
jgi:hypothetical protein